MIDKLLIWQRHVELTLPILQTGAEPELPSDARSATCRRRREAESAGLRDSVGGTIDCQRVIA
jgi:hypothetical protein